MTSQVATSAAPLAEMRVHARLVLIRRAIEDGVALRQTLASTYGDDHVRAQLTAKRWQRPCGAIIVMHNGPLTETQRMWVCLLAAPPGSMLFGLSAAVHDGLKGFPPDRLSLVLPGSSRNPRGYSLPVPDEWGVAVRWSRKLSELDVNYQASPLRTRMPRSIVDAASERVTPRRSRVIVLASAQQRRVKTPDLWDALSRRGCCRNRRIIVESILDAQGGIESLPETEFDQIRRALHLPEPARQVRRRRPDDGHYFLDTEWPEWRVRTEIHGIPHSYVATWDNDLLRQNDVTIDGSGLLIFSSYAIRHVRPRVKDQLLRMFRSRGWRG
jgi:hypothetical protein